MSERAKKTQLEVLSALQARRCALSAYEILALLRQRNPKISAPTIYRALSALSDAGQVHRLETINAFVACKRGARCHSSVLSICDECGAVEESLAPSLLAELARVAGQSGFSVSRNVIEVHGHCAACGDGAA